MRTGGALPSAGRWARASKERALLNLTVLFLHHKADEVTRANRRSLAVRNPDVELIPLADDPHDALPGSWSADDGPVDRGHPYWQCDALVYNWALASPVRPGHVLVVEYDTFCDCRLAPLLAPYARRFDVCGAEVVPPTDAGWSHFDAATRAAFGDALLGVRPFSGVLIGGAALRAIAMRAWALQREGVRFTTNNECRLGILARLCGLTVGQYERGLARELSFSAPAFRRRGLLYHPVKDVVEFL